MMIDDVFDFQILRLTNKFYEDYPSSDYPEILVKHSRSYNCLLFQSHYGYFVCVPYRSEIHHKYAFKFKNTSRSKKHMSGLDYTKTIIITNSDYISSKSSIIDKDEYFITRRNINKIAREALLYIDDYVNHITQKQLLDNREFENRYRLSTLKYFHKELGIL